MAQRKSTIDEAWPGDIVGLPDTGGVFKIGDTITVHFGERTVRVEVVAIEDNARKEAAREMIRYLEE
jgi:peptide subunit release factor RF-3